MNYKPIFQIIYLLIVVVLFTQCEQENKTITEQKCHCGDLVYDEAYNHYYKDERTLPYNGICIELNKNGALTLTKNFVEGKMQGDMIRYQKNGNRASLVEFDQNFIHGKAIFYDINGIDSVVQQYHRGKLVTE